MTQLFSWWDPRSCEASRGVARTPWPWVWGRRCCWFVCRCRAAPRWPWASLGASWPGAGAAGPAGAAGRSRAPAGAGAAASRGPIWASGPRICWRAGFERTPPTCKAGASRVAAKVAARDDRDERCNYRGGPARDPEAGNETRRTVSAGRTCSDGRKGWARSARRPPTLVAHSIPSTDCTDVPGARPSPASATLRVDSETKPVTKPPCNIIYFLSLFLFFFVLPSPRPSLQAIRGGNDLTFPNRRFYFWNIVRGTEGRGERTIDRGIGFEKRDRSDSGVGRQIYIYTLRFCFSGSCWGTVQVRILVNATRFSFFQEARGVSLSARMEGSRRRSLRGRGSNDRLVPLSVASFFLRLPAAPLSLFPPRKTKNRWTRYLPFFRPTFNHEPKNSKRLESLSPFWSSFHERATRESNQISYFLYRSFK